MMNQRSICAISPAKMNETLTHKPGLNNKKKHIDTDTHPRGFTLKNRMRLEHHFNRILHPTCSLFWNFKKWTLLKLLGALVWCALLRKRNFFKYSYGRWKCCGRGERGAGNAGIKLKWRTKFDQIRDMSSMQLRTIAEWSVNCNFWWQELNWSTISVDCVELKKRPSGQSGVGPSSFDEVSELSAKIEL